MIKNKSMLNMIPTSPHKKEIATFTFTGASVTAIGFFAALASGWWAQILWVVFSINLLKLGSDYYAVLQRPDAEEFTVLNPNAKK